MKYIHHYCFSVLSLLLLMGQADAYQVQDSDPMSKIPEGSGLFIHQELRIDAYSSAIYFQKGRYYSDSNSIATHETYCYLQLHNQVKNDAAISPFPANGREDERAFLKFESMPVYNSGYYNYVQLKSSLFTMFTCYNNAKRGQVTVGEMKEALGSNLVFKQRMINQIELRETHKEVFVPEVCGESRSPEEIRIPSEPTSASQGSLQIKSEQAPAPINQHYSSCNREKGCSIM